MFNLSLRCQRLPIWKRQREKDINLRASMDFCVFRHQNYYHMGLCSSYSLDVSDQYNETNSTRNSLDSVCISISYETYKYISHFQSRCQNERRNLSITIWHDDFTLIYWGPCGIFIFNFPLDNGLWCNDNHHQFYGMFIITTFSTVNPQGWWLSMIEV